MPRGKGHRIDTAFRFPGYGAFRDEQRTALPGTVPNMVKLVDRLRDQSITSACVGFAFARALSLRLEIMYPDAETPYPSASAIYKGARLLRGTPLVDVGCEPNEAATWIQTRGIVGEDRVRFDPGAINDELPWDVYQAGADAIVSRAYRFSSQSGADRLAQIDDAHLRGFPVPFGMEVDQSFEEIKGDTAWAGFGGIASGPTILGSHMQCAIYDPDCPSDELTIAGSWSDWGYGPGLVRIKRAFIAGPYCTDFYGIAAAPPGVH